MNDVCQLGIIGQNSLLEAQSLEPDTFGVLEQVISLGFGRCRLSLATPNGMPYEDVSSLAGKTIATSYRGLLSDFLVAKGVDADIVTMEGAVEVAPRTHLADAICDLVSTGSTLVSNGLTERDVILNSQAVIIKNNAMPTELHALSENCWTA